MVQMFPYKITKVPQLQTEEHQAVGFCQFCMNNQLFNSCFFRQTAFSDEFLSHVSGIEITQNSSIRGTESPKET